MSFDLKVYLDKLLGGDVLHSDEAFNIADAIAKGAVDHCQLSALLVLLARSGETAEVVAGFAIAMRQHASRVPHTFPAVQEIVGTGGDGFDTVNISTAASVLTAACGVLVAKHGSVSVSSRSGAADVLKSLGIEMLGPRGVSQCLEQARIAFMFAPKFHPAMAHVVPVRKALKVRTLFNILGPLLNPAGAAHLVLGVYHPRLLPLYADAVKLLGAKHALIVHCCGMDELTPIGPTQIVEVRAGQPHECYTLDPSTFGVPVPVCTVADLKGGEPDHNAAILRRVLEGGDEADGPVGLTIALNAGAALYTFSSAEARPGEDRTWPVVKSIEEGFQVARGVLREGRAGVLLREWAIVSQRLAADEQAETGS